MTIPKGFYHVAGTTKANGLVISDVEGEDLDNTKQGHQFVWVPVDKTTFATEFVRKEGYDQGDVQSCTFNTTGLTYGQYYEPKADGVANTTEVEKMYKSVKDNGGFYIARYEAGTTATSDTGIRGNVVSKKNANVYNNIGWADSNDMSDETGGAVELARNFASANGYTSVTSTLCYGVQWDAALKFIDPDYTGYAKDSKGMGWYEDNYSSGNSTHKTGIDITNKTNSPKNIYDIGGNVWEWTMESHNTSERVFRGGGYNFPGSSTPRTYRPSSRRSSDGPSYTNGTVGFRVTLFLTVSS